MAANMIGVKKRILVFTIGGSIIVPMVNPVIIKKENRYEIEESCLSLTGFRKTTRYEKIEVEYLDKDFKKQKQVFSGFTAQIIQHEIDHFEGITDLRQQFCLYPVSHHHAVVCGSRCFFIKNISL